MRRLKEVILLIVILAVLVATAHVFSLYMIADIEALRRYMDLPNVDNSEQFRCISLCSGYA